jgi:hypothetical protein
MEPRMIHITDTDSAKGGLKRAFLTDQDFIAWLESAEALHKGLMGNGGLLKK